MDRDVLASIVFIGLKGFYVKKLNWFYLVKLG